MESKFRPPSTTTATYEDFLASGWDESSSSDYSYFAWWNSLSNKGFAATAAGSLSKAKVLWLLADSCSFRFEPERMNEPFVSTEANEFGRPRDLDSFGDDDIALLAEVYPSIDFPLLKARLADIVWLRGRPKRDRTAALAAIDAYRRVPLTTDSWYGDGRNCWYRAVKLSRSLRTAAGPRTEEMATTLLAAARSLIAEKDDINATVSVTRALLDLDLVNDSYSDLGEALNTRAERLSHEGKYFWARNHLALARGFFQALRDGEREADMLYAISRTFVGEAEQRTSGKHRSYSVAVEFYGEAIQAVRKIQRAVRVARALNDELESLYARLKEAQTRSLDEFFTIRTEATDLSDICEAAAASVANRDFAAGLYRVAACSRLVSFDEAESQAKALMRESATNRLFGTSRVAFDGRVIDRSPAPGDVDDDSEQTRAAIRARMIRDHQHHMQFTASTAIAPALQQFVLDHLVTIDDIGSIVAQSGVVQSTRAYLVSRGIKAGFDGEFAVALHLLVPQLEHMVRNLLQRKGAKTTTLSPDGIQMEIGLSSLVELPAMNAVFGRDLTFEIQAAFCEQSGPNMRNDVAHGLLDDGAAQSAESLYAWWLVFRMIFLNFWLPDGPPDDAVQALC